MNGVQSVCSSEYHERIFSVGDNGEVCVWSTDGNLQRGLYFAEEGVRLWSTNIISDGEKVVWCRTGCVEVTDVRRNLCQLFPEAIDKKKEYPRCA